MNYKESTRKWLNEELHETNKVISNAEREKEWLEWLIREERGYRQYILRALDKVRQED